MARREGRPYGAGRQCNTLKATDAAYIAGLLDGEGSIGICYRRPTLVSPARFQPAVGINLTRPDPLKWLADMTGLSSVTGPHRYEDGKRAPCFRWMATSGGAVSLLVQVQPFLIIKRVQADRLIEFDAEVRREPFRMGDTRWLYQVKAEFHRLNVRGPRA